MGLLRTIPTKPFSPELPFLLDVKFDELRTKLTGTPAQSVKSGTKTEPPVDPRVTFPHLVGMQQTRDRLLSILNSTRRNNVHITGPKGIGSTSAVEDLMRQRARGELNGRLGEKPFFLFDINEFFTKQPREKWTEAFDAAMGEICKREGVLVVDHMDEFVNIADGESRRLVSALIKRLERQEKMQAIILSENTGEDKVRESSAGIDRRFQTLRLNKEPDDKTLKDILISHFKSFEQKHGVNFSEDTADEMILLLRRYPGRAFTGTQPQSALDFADAVGTYVKNNKFRESPEIAELQEQISLMDDRLAILMTDGPKAKTQQDELRTEIEQAAKELEGKRKELNEKLGPYLKARATFESIDHDISVLREKPKRTEDEETEFSTLTGIFKQAKAKVEAEEKKLYPEPPLVERKHVRAAFGTAANISLAKLNEDKRTRLAKLRPYLDSQIYLQDEAKAALARVYSQREKGRSDPSRPAGILLFPGDTGLGKTELVKALVRFDLGLEDRPDLGDQVEPVTIHLSEYQEKSSVSRITGADPGLVGYGDKIKLLEAVKNNPRAIVLLDEADKAHPALFDLLMQVLEVGKITDSHGDDVSFKDTIIIICMNGVTHKNFKSTAEMHDKEKVREAIRNASSQSSEAKGQKLFRPEFVNRIDDVLVFEPLGTPELQKIMQNELRRLNASYRDSGVSIEADEQTRRDIVTHYDMPGSNGRAPRQITFNYVRPVLDVQADERELRVGSDPDGIPPEHFSLAFDGTTVSLNPMQPPPPMATHHLAATPVTPH